LNLRFKLFMKQPVIKVNPKNTSRILQGDGRIAPSPKGQSLDGRPVPLASTATSEPPGLKSPDG